MPYIIGSEDWGRIEAGLLERSELFNLLVQDLYGPRNLLRKGLSRQKHYLVTVVSCALARVLNCPVNTS